ncbi:MAG: hypothetical protein F4Z02_00185 [Acidimicrobiia bacterium]|nr:hypothetical protein [Acidimicrobiia bacterium]
MISSFDHRAANVVKSSTALLRKNQPRYLTSDDKADPCNTVKSLEWIHDAVCHERIGSNPGYLVGFTNITGTTNERTMACSVLPVTAVSDSIILVRTSKDPHLLLGLLNSFAFDYLVRQKVGGNHISLFYLKQLPVLPHSLLSDYSRHLKPLLLELVYTAWDIRSFAVSLNYAGPPFRWVEERRSLIRAELDALMFHLYGINRQDIIDIMDTFSIVKRKDDQKYGQFRTKNLILDRYDAMTRAFEVAHGTLTDTPNSATPPLDQASLTRYSNQLSKALAGHYQTNISPPPADPSQAHLPSTRPSWADQY